MTKTLVLHVGDPKTGSSAIQKILFHKGWTCDSRSQHTAHIALLAPKMPIKD